MNADDPRSVAIVARAALAGPRLERVAPATLVISGGRVETVAASPPRGAEVVDARGCTLVPGFVDAHVHIAFADPHDVVAGGVTTARDLAWPPAEIHALARRSRAASFDGPLVLAAGPMLTAPGGYPTRAAWAPPGCGREVATPADARAAVATTLDEGACVVKVALNPPVGPTLPRDVLGAIVAAAHARGARVTGHVHGLDELDKALDAGVDELAHMLMSPERIPEATVRRMVAAGMTVVPTLSVRSDDQDVACDNVARFVSAGGRVVYGTDLGNEGPGPGIDAREVGAMTRASMSSRAIVASATVEAAAYLGLARKGVLAPGYDADVVAVEGDADADAGALTRVRMVWRGGRRVR